MAPREIEFRPVPLSREAVEARQMQADYAAYIARLRAAALPKDRR